MHISVNDVNEYAPKFNQPSYVVDVDEGRPADKIIQVEANDADCSAKYGDICRYDILNKDQPFAIDSEGLLPFPLPIDTLCPATLFPSPRYCYYSSLVAIMCMLTEFLPGTRSPLTGSQPFEHKREREEKGRKKSHPVAMAIHGRERERDGIEIPCTFRCF